MNKKKIYVSTVALIDWQGKVLLSLRSKGKGFSNFWEFPGGKIQTKENPDDAAIRELYEELDVKIDKLIPLTFISHSYPSFHLLMPVYICRKWKGSIKSKENQKIQFFNKEELSNIDMLQADKLLIKPLKKILAIS